MKVYYSNPRMNKAAYLLASMSPDMVSDIIDLVNTRGRSLLSDISDEEDGPIRPYAIFSRDYIPDQDFPAIFMGMGAIYVSQLRRLEQDTDFYQRCLETAFFIPKDTAAKLASKIETLDVIGGDANSKTSTLGKLSDKLQETIRRVINVVPGVFGLNWENDQDQQYDLDFLYEVKQFGLIIDDLQSRAHLMKSQAALAKSMGLFAGDKGLYGDVMEAGGDKVDAYECAMGDVAEQEMGGILPFPILGGMAKLAKGAKAGFDKYVLNLAHKAGATGNGSQADPAAVEALDRHMTGNHGPIYKAKVIAGSSSDLETAIALLQGIKSNVNNNDATTKVGQNFGDVVAQHWANGNVEGALGEICDLAGDTFDTTGDPEMDEQIIASVLNEADDEYGDSEGSTDSEFGGLFTRARANMKMRRASRLGRRAMRKSGKQVSRNARNARVIAARQAAQNAGYQNIPFDAEEYVENVRNRGNQMESANPEINPYFQPTEQDGGQGFDGQSYQTSAPIDGGGDYNDQFNMDLIER